MKIILRAPSVNLRTILVQVLFYFAVGCLLASLANAPGQIYLGQLYYIKDAGAVFSFFALAGLATMRNDKLSMLVSAAATALIFVFLPAVPKDETVTTGLTIIWIVKWTVATQLGILIHRERLNRALSVMLAALLLIILLDALIGLWEIHGQKYWFEAEGGGETAAGGQVVGAQQFGELIRIHSIHRSGGDFGNSMAMGMIVTAYLLLNSRRKNIRLTMAPFFLLCAYNVYYSTLRSFLVGAVFGVMALLVAMPLRRWLSRYLAPMAGVMIVACLFFSYYNIIPVVEFVSKHFMSNADLGDVGSSYMRLDTWDDVFADIHHAPIVALIGGPLAAALSFDAPASEICDNVYLWIFYHLGIFGLAGFLVFVPLPLATRTDPRAKALYFAAATQLLITGIFTDSLFYFSSLLMFFALGMILGELRSAQAPRFAATGRLEDEQLPVPESTGIPEG